MKLKENRAGAMPAFLNITTMKKVIKSISLVILCLWSVAQAQTTGYLRYDSVKMAKVGGTTELILENATKGVTGGVLVNTWDGRTAFTLTPSLTGFWKTTGNAGTTAGTNFIGTTDNIDFVGKTNGVERWRWNTNLSLIHI